MDQIVNKSTRDDLEILKKSGITKEFYLAGGTGLALLLKHRVSLDLDFFRRQPFDTKNLIERLKKIGSFSLDKREPGTVLGSFRSTRVSFFYYPYPLLKKPTNQEGIMIASVKDIACMKLDAISSRGTKRDFIDLYAILTNTGTRLGWLLRDFSKKYASLDYNLMHAKKSLVYFADADNDPMPRLRFNASWSEIKKYFRTEIPKISK